MLPVLLTVDFLYRPLWFCSLSWSTWLCMSVLSLAKRAVPVFISWVLIDVVISRVSMYSLVLFFTSYTCTTGRPRSTPDCARERVMLSAIICRSVEPNSLVTVSTALVSP